MSTSVNPTPASGEPPRPPRCVPLSLRFFAVVLVLLGAVGSGWVGVRYSRTKALLDDFRRMGGNPYHHQGGPDWLRRWIGDNGMLGFDEIVSIDMSGTGLTDADSRIANWIDNRCEV